MRQRNSGMPVSRYLCSQLRQIEFDECIALFKPLTPGSRFGLQSSQMSAVVLIVDAGTAYAH